MLKYNEYITEAKKEKEHPFLLAAKSGSANKVKDFIKSSVDINMQDSNKRTALMLASLEGFLIVVNALIDAGADVNLTDYMHRTALMMSKTNSIITKILSAKNIDVNIQDDKGNTVMMEQLTYDYSPRIMIRFLDQFLEKGLNLDIKNNRNLNFYEELQYKILNTADRPPRHGSKLSDLYEFEKYMDNRFPKYKEDWNKNKWDIEWYWKYQLDKNKDKFNL